MEGQDHDLLVEIHTTVKSMKDDFTEMKKDMCNYVRQEEFRPVKAIVYGLVGIILVAVVGSLISLVIINKDTKTAAASNIAIIK